MVPKLLRALAQSAAVATLLAAASAAQAEPFHLSAPERLPFLPHTVVDRSPELCAYVEKTVQAGFLREGRAVFDDAEASVPFRPYTLKLSGNAGEVQTKRANVDLDNDGVVDVLLRHDEWYGGTPGPRRYLTRYADTRSFLDWTGSARSKFEAFGHVTVDAGRSGRPEAVWLGVDPRQAPGYRNYEYAPRSGFTLFAFQGGHYLYLGPQATDLEFELSRPPTLFAAVTKLAWEGAPDLLCGLRASIGTDDKGSILGLSQFRNFDRLLSQIRGRPRVSPCRGGSFSPEFGLAVNRSWVIHSASVAPWRFARFPSGQELYPSLRHDGDIASARRLKYGGLAAWAEQGIWGTRALARLGPAQNDARFALRDHYVSWFGFSIADAGILARRATAALLITTFRFPIDDLFEPMLNDYRNERRRELVGDVRLALADSAELSRVLKGALIYGLPLKDIESLIEQGASVAGMLPEALGRPEHMAFLLERGVDVNEGNPFGKTALMFAAHLDDAASARFLLERGADPNAVTRPLSHCQYDVKIGGRTALMYAAENASRELIDLLITAGADRDARDTRGWRAADYFALNERVEGDQREATLRLLGN